MPIEAVYVAMLVGDCGVRTCLIPGQYVRAALHRVMSLRRVCTPTVNAYPGAKSLQAAMLAPLALFVVPVGHVIATALLEYVPFTAVKLIMLVGVVRFRPAPTKPGQ